MRELGLKLAVMPLGKPLMLKATALLKPSATTVLTVVVPLVPAWSSNVVTWLKN